MLNKKIFGLILIFSLGGGACRIDFSTRTRAFFGGVFGKFGIKPLMGISNALYKSNSFTSGHYAKFGEHLIRTLVSVLLLGYNQYILVEGEMKLLSRGPSLEAISKIFTDFASGQSSYYYSKALRLFLSYYQSRIIDEYKVLAIKLLKSDFKAGFMMGLSKFKDRYYPLVRNIGFDLEDVLVGKKQPPFTGFVYLCSMYSLSLKLVDQTVFSLDNPTLATIFSDIAGLFDGLQPKTLAVSMVANRIGMSESLLRTLISEVSHDYGYVFSFARDGDYLDYWRKL